ncbi:hypothetical protein [Pararobbsia silviterrae]|uniref:Glycosyltransferase family 1 protein n=1 Tax=Pararobbsia silviterrae TaxID=1792498 RepID=A0A494X982_9BURK|nr:hypothetical protein [Pararobbsia silviterrae]RKP46191.1 hypothetical protein D7S86_25050 [Pararobbsia silviterrae]
MNDTESVFLPQLRRPFYIVAPRYVRTSAGIKVLHYLCHALNRMGEQAFLVVVPHYSSYLATHPSLNTPVLTKRIMDFHRENGLTPITIYPESVKGNPLNAPFVVRYVLNYAGLLGGDDEFHEDEYCISYSESIAGSVPHSHHTIFIPASDPTFFTAAPGVQRKGACFYAGKYKYYHGAKTYPITDGLQEITRDRPGAQTPAEIRDLFQRSEVFYCYENSALIIEAILCGCPVVLLPNEHFTDVIGKVELGDDGYVWGADDAAGLERARQTLAIGRERYLSLYAQAEQALREFVASTQAAAESVPYAQPMSDDYVERITWFARIGGLVRTVRYLIRDNGFGFTVKLVLTRLKLGRIALKGT